MEGPDYSIYPLLTICSTAGDVDSGFASAAGGENSLRMTVGCPAEVAHGICLELPFKVVTGSWGAIVRAE